MKKSQILAALALAFALGLGVVAPVANTYAVEYTDVVVRTTGEATGAEVEAAINYVQSNATYNKVAAVAKAFADYPAATYDIAATTTVANFQAKITALNGAFVNGTDGEKIVASYSSSDTLGQLAQKAAATTNYTLYSEFVKDMAATPFNIEAVKEDVRKMNEKGITAVNLSTWGVNGAVSTAANVTAALTTTTSYDKVANYDDFATLVGYVNNVNNYKEAYKNLTSVLSAALKEGSTALDNAEEFTTTIAALRGMANDTNITNYTKWVDVYNKVVAADGYTAKASTGNYDKVMDIAEKWAIALPDNDNSDAVIAEVMMGYKGGAQTPNLPEDNDNKGDDNDNNGDDQKDPSAPGTGVLSSADGNAATTVSIVAGLATALTALGAGVVAYRSARRSNK